MKRFKHWLDTRYAPSTAQATMYRINAAFSAWERGEEVKAVYKNALQRLARYAEENGGDLDGFPQEFIFGVAPARGEIFGLHKKETLSEDEWRRLHTHLLNLETDEGFLLAHYMDYGPGPIRTYLQTPITMFGKHHHKLKERLEALRVETPEGLLGRATQLANYARLRRCLMKESQDVLLRPVDFHTLDTTRKHLKTKRVLRSLGGTKL